MQFSGRQRGETLWEWIMEEIHSVKGETVNINELNRTRMREEGLQNKTDGQRFSFRLYFSCLCNVVRRHQGYKGKSY